MSSAKRPPPVPTFVLRGAADSVYALAWSHDGTMLASGSGDGALMLWDVATRRCTVRVMDAHAAAVIGVFFVGPWLWTQGRDGLLKQWHVADARCVSAHHVDCQGFVPMCVASGAEPVALVPDPGDMRSVVALNLGDSVVQRWHWSPPDVQPAWGMCMRVAAACGLGVAVYEGARMAVLDVASGACRWTGAIAHCEAASGDDAGATATCVCWDGTRGFVGLSSRRVVPFTWTESAVQWADAAVALPIAGVADVALRPHDARVWATAGWDGRVRLFSAKAALKPLCVCDYHSGTVLCVSFAPTSNVVASGGKDGRIALWTLY